jgi:hypothetical protein
MNARRTKAIRREGEPRDELGRRAHVNGSASDGNKRPQKQARRNTPIASTRGSVMPNWDHCASW